MEEEIKRIQSIDRPVEQPMPLRMLEVEIVESGRAKTLRRTPVIV